MPSIGVSPLQLSHKCRPIPSKATAINTDECSKGIFQTLKFGKTAELFFAINCQKNNFSMPLYELTLNLRGKRCLLLPKRSESYSFRCLNKPIFNRKFISNFPQQIDRFLINLLIRARLISHGGVVVSLCRKISSVNGHTSFSICYVINPSGRWKKMKRV